MILSPGDRLGPYEILSPLGAGGMGEVYRARDTKLGRDVAIKILPAAFAADADRLARFQREAQLLASLNHPSIAAIYGIDDSTDATALVLELVDGLTLAERIEALPAHASGLPVDEALAIAKQIADAVEAAHEQGIIHRDLKPANVKVRADGAVKVLDFGLAKILESPEVAHGLSPAKLSMSPTLSIHATYAGMILGTAAYMSPEQARGKPVDRRTDIWAFGCVLFEMLTGKRAFDAGETASDAIASILTREPDLAALPATTPAAIRTLLRRCLEKNPQKRLPHISGARLEIEEALSGGVGQIAPPVRTEARRVNALPIAAAVVAASVLTAVVAWTMKPPAPARQVLRLQATSRVPITLSTVVADVALSPDGGRLAFVAGAANQLHVRRLTDAEAKPLDGIVNIRGPFFSPDGEWIGYFQGSDLKKVSSNGGPPLTICRTCAPGNRGGTWVPDDTIIFSASGGSLLQRVPAGGGDVVTLAERSTGDAAGYSWPEILPGGTSVLFTTSDGAAAERSRLAVRDLKTGVNRVLVIGAGQGHYVNTGHLVFGVVGTLRAVPFDLAKLAIAGNPVPVLERVMMKPTGAADFAISQDGMLVYVSGTSAIGGQTLTWIDRQRHEEATGAPFHNYVMVRISPDGRRLAADIREVDNDIWIWDFGRKTLSRATFGSATEQVAIWTPDGRRIAFRSDRLASMLKVFWQAADGTGQADQLTQGVGAETPYSFSPDAKWLVYGAIDPKTQLDLYVRSMIDGTTRPLLRTPSVETNAEISPDGRWMAYQSNESGDEQVYVRPFPDVNAGRWQVSTAGGTRPAWARSGGELFYLDPSGRLMATAVHLAPAFQSGAPAVVTDTLFNPPTPSRYYDVSPDGNRFIVITQPKLSEEGTETRQVEVVLNWGEELKRLVPVRR